MFLFASGASYEEIWKSTGRIVARSNGAGEVRLSATTLFCPVGARCGVGVAVGLTEARGELLPKPINVHHRKMMATNPRTEAQMTFFFSPGLFRSTRGIFLLLTHGAATTASRWK